MSLRSTREEPRGGNSTVSSTRKSSNRGFDGLMPPPEMKPSSKDACPAAGWGCLPAATATPEQPAPCHQHRGGDHDRARKPDASPTDQPRQKGRLTPLVPLLDPPAGQRLPVAQARLRQELADVPLGPVDRDPQPDRDLGVRPPLDQRVEHAALALVQLPAAPMPPIALLLAHATIMTASRALSLPDSYVILSAAKNPSAASVTRPSRWTTAPEEPRHRSDSRLGRRSGSLCRHASGLP